MLFPRVGVFGARLETFRSAAHRERCLADGALDPRPQFLGNKVDRVPDEGACRPPA